jgi:hypothetical protein
MKSSIAYIYNGKPHMLSVALADAIDAEKYGIKSTQRMHFISGTAYCAYLAIRMPRKKVYFVESLMGVFVPLFKRIFRFEKNIIIYRGIDSIFYKNEKGYLASDSLIQRKVAKFLIKKIDWVIADSTLVLKDANEQGVDGSVCFCGFVPNAEELLKQHTKLDTNNFMFAGEYRPPYDHKDISHLIKVFNYLPVKYQLNVMGKRTDELKKYVKRKGISTLGFVKDVKPIIDKTTFYIQLPKYEAGPLTIVEAMLRGQIPVVNDMTGFKTIVEKIDPILVIPSSLSDIMTAERIKDICSTDKKTRERWSKTARSIARKLDKGTVIKNFKKEMDSVIKKLWKQKGYK